MKLSESVPDAALEERISQQAINKCCTLIYTVSLRHSTVHSSMVAFYPFIGRCTLTNN